MPRTETVLSIFVVSPSDVSEERDQLEREINQINATLARRTGVRLELLKWERDASPAFDEDPQAVINRQIPQDYDIFIGILWHRIGSRTSRAESGTVEEFNSAKARFDKDPSSVRLMLYFKDAAPLSLSDIDADQLKQVKDFQERVSQEGGFYSKFTTVDDFATQVCIDLMKHVLEWEQEGEGAHLDEDMASPSQPEGEAFTSDIGEQAPDQGDSDLGDFGRDFLHFADSDEDDFEDNIFDLQDLARIHR